MIINVQQEDEDARIDAESNARIDAEFNTRMDLMNNIMLGFEQLLYDCEFIKTQDEYNNLIGRYNNMITKMEIMMIDELEELEFSDKHLEQGRVAFEKGNYIEEQLDGCLDEHSERLFN